MALPPARYAQLPEVTPDRQVVLDCGSEERPAIRRRYLSSVRSTYQPRRGQLDGANSNNRITVQFDFAMSVMGPKADIGLLGGFSAEGRNRIRDHYLRFAQLER